MDHAHSGCVYLTPSIGKRLPPVLLALIVGTVVGNAFFPSLPVIGNIPTGFPLLFGRSCILAPLPWWKMLRVLALLGAIDGLSPPGCATI
ncbi:MAG: hypothetical protein R3B83_03750 [Nitrospirales bacterium]|nr:hypothetical protein [Nitrospirales bacterium]